MVTPIVRPRVASTARKAALGWSKRNTGKSSTDQKENVGQGAIMRFVSCFILLCSNSLFFNAFIRHGETLRLNPPRPRGGATPASQHHTSSVFES